MEPRVITNWSVRGSAYQAPEMRKIYIGGQCEGKPILTSRVVEKVSLMVYRTRSGSLYRLEGPPEPGYVAYCVENRIELDPEDPIKIKRSEVKS